MKKIKERFDKWCAKERVGRVEEGTSQDMCSTNGALLAHIFVCSIIGSLIALAILCKVKGW